MSLRGSGASRLTALLLAATALAAAGAGAPPGRLPPIVFVSRQPIAGDPLSIPGFGPHQRAAAPGGRLLVREPSGRTRELLARGVLFDVSDPAVSPDGRRIAFAGTTHPDSGWRLYEVGIDGAGLRRIGAATDAEGNATRWDDLDPCWLDDRTLCFSSTRYRVRAAYADVPATNLFVLRLDDATTPPRRITSEHNGAEEPALEPASGRVVFARWWFNPFRASRRTASGLTADPALAARGDSVNLWHLIEVLPDGRDARLAAGDVRSRRGTTAYQPAVLSDGTLCAVYALNLGLWPRPGPTGIHRFPRRFGFAERLAGAIVPEREGDPYAEATGLAAPSACAPAALPDGRVLFSYSPGGRGDFGIYVMRRDGTDLRRVVDLPGTLELDAAPILRRPTTAAVREALAALDQSGPRRALPPANVVSLGSPAGTFRYRCLNLFFNAPPDDPIADAPPLVPGVRLRFYAAISRPIEAGGDTVALIREVPVAADGSVDESGLPADVPMFEQAVDPEGRVLLSSHGPAHVAGFNSGTPGGVTRCIGCHVGHSTMLERGMGADPSWFNAATSARVTTSSVAPGDSARAAVDRRTRGTPMDVAWVARGAGAEWVRLEWPVQLELRRITLYGIARDTRDGTDVNVRAAELRLFHKGREVERRKVRGVRSEGTQIDLHRLVVDAVELRIMQSRGRITGVERTGLAEIETIARRPMDRWGPTIHR